MTNKGNIQYTSRRKQRRRAERRHWRRAAAPRHGHGAHETKKWKGERSSVRSTGCYEISSDAVSVSANLLTRLRVSALHFVASA
eukprot:30916-Pelagococcus_subviridis.AAC.7